MWHVSGIAKHSGRQENRVWEDSERNHGRASRPGGLGSRAPSLSAGPYPVDGATLASFQKRSRRKKQPGGGVVVD